MAVDLYQLLQMHLRIPRYFETVASNSLQLENTHDNLSGALKAFHGVIRESLCHRNQALPVHHHKVNVAEHLVFLLPGSRDGPALPCLEPSQSLLQLQPVLLGAAWPSMRGIEASARKAPFTSHMP